VCFFIDNDKTGCEQRRLSAKVLNSNYCAIVTMFCPEILLNMENILQLTTFTCTINTKSIQREE